jgi:hypothetical protein
MAVLPDISVRHQIHQALLSVDSLSDDELVEGARQMLCAGTAFHIAAGRFFIAMKERFRGRFIEVVEMEFDQSIDVIEALMAIAREFPDHNTWCLLPSCWTTLERLTRISQDVRDRWIHDGTIHPRLTEREARELVQRAKILDSTAIGDNSGDHDSERGDDDRGGDQDGDRGDHRGGDQDGDHRDDDHGDTGAEPDGGDHSEPRANLQSTNQIVAREDIGVDGSNAELERLKAHIEELEAYIEQLEAQAGYSENKTEALERRNAELEAVTGLGNVGWNQRQLLTRAIEAAQKAIQSKDDSKERLSLQKDAGTYIIELVRSARRDGLDVERFDLAYRPRPEEKLTKGEESSAPLGADAQLQAGG